MLANTGKPVFAWTFTPDNMGDIYQIALAAADSEEDLRQRPFFALFTTYQSPLQITDAGDRQRDVGGGA